MSSQGVPDKVGSLRAIEGEFGVILRRIRRVMDDRARELHADLSAPSYWLVAALRERGPTRASDLVETFGLDKGAVSRYVAQLAALGMIEREPDPNDGRAQLLKLSPTGQQRLDAVAIERRTELAARFDEWSETELHTLATLLHRYNVTADPNLA